MASPRLASRTHSRNSITLLGGLEALISTQTPTSSSSWTLRARPCRASSPEMSPRNAASGREDARKEPNVPPPRARGRAHRSPRRAPRPGAHRFPRRASRKGPSYPTHNFRADPSPNRYAPPPGHGPRGTPPVEYSGVFSDRSLLEETRSLDAENACSCQLPRRASRTCCSPRRA